MANFTNQTKNSTSFANGSLGNYLTWADPMATWADPIAGWAQFRGDIFARETKHSTSFNNQVKN